MTAQTVSEKLPTKKTPTVQTSQWWRRLTDRRYLPTVGTVATLILLLVVGQLRYSTDDRSFISARLFSNLFIDNSYLLVLAIGMTFVIISGGIDISVGSIMGLSAMVTALALQSIAPETSAVMVLLIGIAVPLAVGAGCGLVNGALVVGLRMHPFIVTLATLSMFRWVCLKIGVTYGASLPSGDKVLPAAFTDHFIAWSVP